MKGKRVEHTKDALAYVFMGASALAYGLLSAGIYAYDSVQKEVERNTSGFFNGLRYSAGKFLFGFLEKEKQDVVSFTHLVKSGALDSAYDQLDTYVQTPLVGLSAGIVYFLGRYISSAKKLERKGEVGKLAAHAISVPLVAHTIDTSMEVAGNLVNSKGLEDIVTSGYPILENAVNHPLMSVTCAALGSSVYFVHNTKKKYKTICAKKK